MVHVSQAAFSIVSTSDDYPVVQLEKAIKDSTHIHCYLTESSTVLMNENLQHAFSVANQKTDVTITTYSLPTTTTKSNWREINPKEIVLNKPLNFQTLIVLDRAVYFEKNEPFEKETSEVSYAHTYFSDDIRVVEKFTDLLMYDDSLNTQLTKKMDERSLIRRVEWFRESLITCIKQFENIVSNSQNVNRNKKQISLEGWKIQTISILEFHLELPNTCIPFTSDTAHGSNYLSDILNLNQYVEECMNLLHSDQLVKMTDMEAGLDGKDIEIHAELTGSPEGIYDHLIGTNEDYTDADDYIQGIEMLLRDLQDAYSDTSFQAYPAYLYVLDKLWYITYYLQRIILFMKY